MASSSSSSFISNIPDASNSAEEQQPKRKRRRIQDRLNPTITRWRTQTEQQIYCSNLLHALRHVPRFSNSPTVHGVRQTADRVLAIAAKGTTRWSRAILTTRLRINKKHKKRRILKRSTVAEENRNLPALQRKVRLLGNLVPGCRKLSLPNLLEETSDYIAALEMQVRAMADLTGIHTVSNGVNLSSS